MSEVLSYNTSLAWIDRKTGKNPSYIYPSGRTLDEQINWMQENLKPNNRYTIQWIWRTGGGHIIHIFKNSKNQLSFYDPQIGVNNRENALISSYFEKTITKTFKLLDVEACDININVVKEIITERKK